ncbi:MAG: DUF6279 family lipoprotein [Burkholderiaceae bacterium]
MTVSITACSLVRSGYGWLPTAVNWRLASYLTPTREQQNKIDEHLESLLEWHRTVELPRYATLLERIAAHPALAADAAGQPAAIGMADLQRWRAQAEEVWPPLAQRLAAPVAEIAVTLDAGQLAEIRAGIRARQRKILAEHGGDDPARRVAHRVERWESRLERLLGELTDRQRALIAARVAEMPANERWWQARFDWQQGFVDELERLVREKATADQAAPRVRVWLDRWLQPGDDAARALAEDSADDAQRLIVELLGSAEPAQRAHARTFLGQLANDFRELSRGT